jgi:8-oxo-dGTP diphosphatase
VGAIVDRGSRTVLLAQRAADAHQGGLWEFPGGKLEPGETVTAALVRELMEELAIIATESEPLLKVCHDYSDKRVLLDVWLVTAFVGKPLARQGQPLQWVAIEELQQWAFPAANGAIVNALQRRFAAS